MRRGADQRLGEPPDSAPDAVTGQSPATVSQPGKVAIVAVLIQAPVRGPKGDKGDAQPYDFAIVGDEVQTTVVSDRIGIGPDGDPYVVGFGEAIPETDRAVVVTNVNGEISLARVVDIPDPEAGWLTGTEVQAKVDGKTLHGNWQDIPPATSAQRTFYAKDVDLYYLEVETSPGVYEWQAYGNVYHIGSTGHTGNGEPLMDKLESLINKAKLAGADRTVIKFDPDGEYLMERAKVFTGVQGFYFDFGGAKLIMPTKVTYIPFTFDPTCKDVTFFKPVTDGGWTMWSTLLGGSGTSFMVYQGSGLTIEEPYGENWGAHFLKDGTQIAGNVPGSPTDLKNARTIFINGRWRNCEMLFLSEIGSSRQTRFEGHHLWQVQGCAKYTSDVQGGIDYPRTPGMYLHGSNTYSEAGKAEGFFIFTATGGTQTITISNRVPGGAPGQTVSYTTAALGPTPTVAEVQAAVEALPNVGVGNVIAHVYSTTRIALSFPTWMRDVDIRPDVGALTGGTTTFKPTRAPLFGVQGGVFGLIHHDEIVDDAQWVECIMLVSNKDGVAGLPEAGGNINSHHHSYKHLWNAVAVRAANNATAPFTNVRITDVDVDRSTHGVINLNSGKWEDIQLARWRIRDWSSLGDGVTDRSITRRAIRCAVAASTRGLQISGMVFRRSTGATRHARSAAVQVVTAGLTVRINDCLYTDPNNVNNDAMTVTGALALLREQGNDWSDGKITLSNGATRQGYYLAPEGDLCLLLPGSGVVLQAPDGGRVRLALGVGGAAGGVTLTDVPPPVQGNGGDDGVDDGDDPAPS